MDALPSWLIRIFRLFGAPMFVLGLAAVAGILTGDAFPQISVLTWGLAAVLGLGLAWRTRPVRWKLFLVGAVTFAFLQRSANHDPLREILSKPGGLTWCHSLTGVVSDAPEQDSAGKSWRFPLRLDKVHDQACSSLVNVRWFGPRVPSYGNRLVLSGRVSPPNPVKNPGEFDWEAWLHRQGFAASFLVDSLPPPRWLEPGGGNRVMHASLRARDWIGNAVTADLEDDPQIAATVKTMILGTQESTPQDVEDAFVDSGTMHVFAVSGLHVALFALVLGQVLGLLRVPRTMAVLIIIPVMIFYVYITGLRASAWRAALMASLVLLGTLMDRPAQGFTSLGFAALLLLGWDPQQLFQAGFQLSFGVVFMLAWWSGPLLQWIAPWHEPEAYIPRGLHTHAQRGAAWCRKIILQSLVVSICATVGSAPLMIHHFGLVAPVGIFANLFLVILSEIILAVACLSLICAGLKFTWLSLLSNNTNWALAKGSIWFAKFFASLPGGHFRVDPSRWWDDSTARITVLAMRDGGAAIHLDLGGHHWMLDTGPQNSFLFSQRSYLLRYPITKLEGIVLTHQDSDHIRATGLTAMMFAPHSVIAPGNLKLSAIATQLPPPLLSPLQIRPTATLTRLYPPPHLDYGVADDRCQVWRCDVDGWRILFQSDAGFIAEKWLLENHVDVTADVLIKGHHTQDFSGLSEFLDAVAPRAICFTNLRWPGNERVSGAWIERLRDHAIPYFDQGESGAVEISLTPQVLNLRGFVDGKSVELRKPP